MWVSRLRPLTSPTAYSQSPSTPVHRSQSSTVHVPARLEARRSRGRGRAVRGRRPVATSISSAMTLVRPRRWSVTSPPGSRPLDPGHSAPVRTVMPGVREGVRQHLAGERLRPRPSSRSPRSTIVTSLGAEPAVRLRHLARRRRRRRARPAARGTCSQLVASRLVHGCASRQAGHRRDGRVAAGGEHDGVPGGEHACDRRPAAVTTTRLVAVEPACPRTTCDAGALDPLHLAAVVVACARRTR